MNAPDARAIHLPADLYDDAAAVATAHGRSVDEQVAHWVRIGMAVDRTPGLDRAAIAAALAGRASYLRLGDLERAIVEATWEARHDDAEAEWVGTIGARDDPEGPPGDVARSRRRPPPSAVPSVVDIARVLHALSDEARDGIGFHEPGCRCPSLAPRVRRLIAFFYGPPTQEPDGLGAVVVDPSSGGVWVRAAHPALAPSDQELESPEQWFDPARDNFCTWDQVPARVIVQNPGWTPPPPP